MATMISVENAVQAKNAIESLMAEGYEQNHIHVFANSNKRADDIAKYFDVDAGSTATTNEVDGFFAAIKNLFQTTPDEFHKQLQEIGATPDERTQAKLDLDDGKVVIFAHHPDK